VQLIEDPDREERILSVQLRENGLYAANILGGKLVLSPSLPPSLKLLIHRIVMNELLDGNCLFRALSDQLFGSPSQHLQLRDQICDFLISKENQERFKVFVDLDDYKSGWEGYVREMRQPGK